MKQLFAIVAAFAVMSGCATSGDNEAPAAQVEATAAEENVTPAFQEPINYIPAALGPYSWKVTTSSDMSQKYFDQGIQMRFAYGMNDAARSFRQAHFADPDCAMCYWGEAFSLGSFLNGGMSAEKAPYAHEAIEKAVELSGNATELERDLIMAARDRYPADYDPDNRRPVDEAFAEHMKVLYEKYPGNHEVAVVYAVAIFLLEERRGYRDINDPDLIHLHQVLTGVLDEDITHPGACHLYIHATESSQQPQLALPCADYLSDAVPAASHIQHMPSHTWNEVGYWGRSVRANIKAWNSDLKSRQGEGFSYAPGHNLHMLLFAASMDGQGAIATQAGKDYAKETDNSMYQVLTLLRFGRYDEIPAVTDRPTADVAGGFWDFAQGYAAAHNGDMDLANEYLAKVQTIAAESTAKFRFHDASTLMGLSAAILEGEIKRLEGDLDGAIAAFRRAAEFDDQQPYDEPEPIPYAARHWLGAALLEAGRYAEAEQEYRTELADHPHNVWSLTGLKAALEGQGKTDPEVDADFEASTSRMDIWITTSVMQ
jgi:tetratricopeptide (TPR) repeat protein